MANISSYLGITLAFLIAVCSAQHSFVIEVVNTAGKSGEQINLYTQAQKDPNDANSDYVGWEYYPGQTVTIWAENKPDDIVDPAKFYHEHTPLDNNRYDYNLTIYAEPTLSGPYQASFLLDRNTKTTAQVVVLDYIQCPPEGETKEEDQTIMVTCETTYYGYKNPVMKWYAAGAEVPGNILTVDPDTNSVMATVNITAGPEHDELEMICHLSFELEEGEDPSNGDPPTYTDECVTYYLVNHAVTDIQIYPDPDNAQDGVLELWTGEAVNCSASGRPPPLYYWYCDDGVPVAEGYEMYITEDFVRGEQVTCKCEARNTVNGQPRTVEKEFKFVAYLTQPSDSPSTAGADGWVIAVGILVPLIVIGVIVGVVFYMVKVRDEKPKPITKPPIPKQEPGQENNSFTNPGVNEPRPDFQPTGPHNPSLTGYGNPAGPYGGMTRQGYPGKGSPGYADLGIHHLNNSHVSLNSSSNSLADPYANIRRNPVGTKPSAGPAGSAV